MTTRRLFIMAAVSVAIPARRLRADPFGRVRASDNPFGCVCGECGTCRERAIEQAECLHEWEEEYYGTRCAKCHLFYPHGCAPWDMPDDDEFADMDRIDAEFLDDNGDPA